jgi:hypothetical protein
LEARTDGSRADHVAIMVAVIGVVLPMRDPPTGRQTTLLSEFMACPLYSGVVVRARGGRMVGNDGVMDKRRVVLVVTCLAVAALAVVLMLMRWEQANKVATSLSALAGVAAVGVAIWAAFPRPVGTTIRVTNSGKAIAGRAGGAQTGVRASADLVVGDITVRRSGDANATGDGNAATGVELN